MEYKTIKIGKDLHDLIKEKYPDISIAKALQELMDDKYPKAIKECLSTSDLSTLKSQLLDMIYPLVKDNVRSQLDKGFEIMEDRFARIESEFQR